MHLEAMLVFVDGLGHPFELAGFVKCCCRFAVHCKFTERCGVVRTFRQSGFREVEVVRWPEEEYTFAKRIDQ